MTAGNKLLLINYDQQKWRPVFRTLLIPTFSLLVCMRLPNVIHQGRFWAEEGTVFYYHACKLPWLQAIFNSYAGYTNVSANLAAVLAYYLVPLKSAPYITTGFAAMVQTFPAILICMSGQSWLRKWPALIAALLIVLVQPASQEIWLSSIGSQCFLNLCVGLILALQTETAHAKRFFQYFLLLLAPLSGPGASFFLPFMIARAIIDKSKMRAFQATVLGMGTIVQLVFFYHKSDRNMTADVPLFLSAMFVKHIMVPVLGRVESMDTANQLHTLAQTNELPLAPMLAVLALFGSMAFLIFRSRAYQAFWPMLSAFLITPLSFFGALGDRTGLLGVDGGNRYTYAPQVLLEFSLLIMCCTSRDTTIKSIAKWLLAWLLVIGMHEYFNSADLFAQGPEWRNEVRKWQADRSYKMHLWPATWPLQIRPDELAKHPLIH